MQNNAYIMLLDVISAKLSGFIEAEYSPQADTKIRTVKNRTVPIALLGDIFFTRGLPIVS